MMQSLMRAAAALVSSKDDAKYMITGKKFLFQTQCCVYILETENNEYQLEKRKKERNMYTMFVFIY